MSPAGQAQCLKELALPDHFLQTATRVGQYFCHKKEKCRDGMFSEVVYLSGGCRAGEGNFGHERVSAKGLPHVLGLLPGAGDDVVDPGRDAGLVRELWRGQQARERNRKISVLLRNVMGGKLS